MKVASSKERLKTQIMAAAYDKCDIFLDFWDIMFEVSYDIKYIMGLDVRKPVFRGLRTTKAHTAQSEQHLCYSLIGKYHNKQNFTFLVSLCG